MAEFSDEEYLRVLADNGDREAVKEYEQALDNLIFSCKFHWLKLVIRGGVRKCKNSWNKRKRKRNYFQEKEDKAVSEFRRRKTERTRGRKVSSFNKLKDLKKFDG